MIDVKVIKKEIDIKTLIEFYGVKFNSKGFASCPFHKDNKPSFHTKGEIYTCFSCGAQGDVVDYVQKIFHLSFVEALEKINTDFHLGMTKDKCSKEYYEKKVFDQKISKILNHYRDEIYLLMFTNTNEKRLMILQEEYWKCKKGDTTDLYLRYLKEVKGIKAKQ